MKAPEFQGLRKKRAARDLYCGSLPSPLKSPGACKDSGPAASYHTWGFSGKSTVLHLSLQWNNPALAILFIPACLTRGQAHGISQMSVWLPHQPPPA